MRLFLWACVCAVIAGPAATADASTPRGGTAAAIPGTIAAANFDDGGEGDAYHDTSPGNSGGAYRSDNVDIESSSDGGFDVGWTAAGEWLKYTVAVSSAGAYTAAFRVAAFGQGGTFHLEMNGVNVTGPITIPDTGGWQTYQSVSRTVTLASGTQVGRLVMDSPGVQGSIGNFTTISFTSTAVSTPFNATPVTLPAVVRAENFDNGGEGVAYHDSSRGNTGGAYRQTDVDLEASSEGGFDVGWTTPGEWLNYSVDAGSGGAFTVTFRVASSGGGGTFHLEANGANVTGMITVPNTGGWQSWQSVTTRVTLPVGKQIVRLVMDGGAGTKGVIGNIAWLRFDRVSAATSTPFSGAALSIPGTIEAEAFDNGGEGVAYHDTTSGNTGGAFRSTDVDVEAAASGGYDVGWAVAGEWLNYSVNVSAAGAYTVGFRVASSGQGGSFHLEMNGINVSGAIDVPDTGGWQSWQTVTRSVTLAAGAQIARLVMDSNAAKAVANFDSFQFTAGSAQTPPPNPPPGGGTTIVVPAGGDLQGAIDAAQPGDTITLAAGATYHGQFVLRVKPGSSYITIRSSAADSSLPADGVRALPSNAGSFARLQGGIAGMPVITTEPGAHHYRFMFLEMVSTYRDNQIVEIGTFGANQDALAEVPHHIVFDRCYIHGDAVNGQKRAILLNAASASVVNSYIADIKSPVDESQGIGISNGPGPFTIVNNYIEAAGENILFGGADPSIANLVPSDILIQNNHITKQPTWKALGYIVKNLLEFKNAQRVVIDNNLIEYCWQQSQQGYAIVLTPRNQEGGAPWSVVQHVQITNNVVRHVANVFNLLGLDNINTNRIVTNDISVRNNLFLDISVASWGGSGVLLTAEGGSNIVFDHNTVFTDGTSVVFADNPPVSGFVFTNNIIPDNAWAIMGSGQSPGTGTLKAYFPGATFGGNVLIGGNAATYPSGNFFPATLAAVGFVNISGGDYRLSSGSAYAHAATDGTAVGYSGPLVR